MKFNTQFKFKGPHLTTNLNTILSIALVLVLVFELYLAYNYLYKDLVTAPVVLDNDSIVRVDNKSYTATINLLDDRNNFRPDNPLPANSDPFR